MDCILIANESVEDYRHWKKKGLIVKLDLKKAYDYTNWDLLDYMISRKGFGSKWRSWIYGCLASSHFSILINGSAKGFFPTSRGLKHGDSLSPFLFTLVVDAFSKILKNGEIRIGKESFPSLIYNMPTIHCFFQMEVNDNFST